MTGLELNWLVRMKSSRAQREARPAVTGGFGVPVRTREPTRRQNGKGNRAGHCAVSERTSSEDERCTYRGKSQAANLPGRKMERERPGLECSELRRSQEKSSANQKSAQDLNANNTLSRKSRNETPTLEATRRTHSAA
jgi:hypothetical protein